MSSFLGNAKILGMVRDAHLTGFKFNIVNLWMIRKFAIDLV